MPAKEEATADEELLHDAAALALEIREQNWKNGGAHKLDIGDAAHKIKQFVTSRLQSLLAEKAELRERVVEECRAAIKKKADDDPWSRHSIYSALNVLTELKFAKSPPVSEKEKDE